MGFTPEYICSAGFKKKTNYVTGEQYFIPADIKKMPRCGDKNKDGKCNDYRYQRPKKGKGKKK